MVKNSKTPFSILRKGLNTLKYRVQTCKIDLEAKLRPKEKSMDADEEWLDNDGNVIDEQHILETLETASNYERGVERLNNMGKGIVQQQPGERLIQQQSAIAGEKPISFPQ